MYWEDCASGLLVNIIYAYLHIFLCLCVRKIHSHAISEPYMGQNPITHNQNSAGYSLFSSTSPLSSPIKTHVSLSWWLKCAMIDTENLLQQSKNCNKRSSIARKKTRSEVEKLKPEWNKLISFWPHDFISWHLGVRPF